MLAPLTLNRIVKWSWPSRPTSVDGSVSLPVTSVNTRNPMRRVSVTAAPPVGVKVIVRLYRFWAPGVCAGHHSATALLAAASVTVALEAPAGRVTGADAAPPAHAPTADSVPDVAAGAEKWTTTSTEKSPWAASLSGAVGYAPL